MAVTNEEAANAYEILVQAARSAGLDWVVREVEEEIALGRVELRALSVEGAKSLHPQYLFPDDELLPEGTLKAKPRSRATFNISRPLTQQERLLELVRSLRSGVVELNWR